MSFPWVPHAMLANHQLEWRAVLGGVRIPTRAEVRWELAGGPSTSWRGTVTALEVDPVQ